MPITASLGALAYSRIDSGTTANWQYYAIKINNYSPDSVVFDSTSNNYYVSASYFTTDVPPIAFKINDNSQPVINWTYSYPNASYSAYSTTTNTLYYDNNTGILSLCGGRQVFSDTTVIPEIVNINPTSGLIYSANAMVYGNSTGGSLIGPVKDSSNNFYVLNASTSGSYNTAILSKLNKISYDGSNPTVSAYYTMREELTADTMFPVALSIDSSGNPFGLYSFFANPTPTRHQFGLVVKFNSSLVVAEAGGTSGTPIGLAINSSNQLIVTATRPGSSKSIIYKIANSGFSGGPIWVNNLNNAAIKISKVCVDTSDNIYCLAYSSTDTYIYKFDTSGTVLFVRKLSISSSTISPKSINVKNNIMYITASTGSTDGLIIKLPADGTILAGGRYFFTGGYSGVLTYASSSETAPATSISSSSAAFYSVDGAPTFLSRNVNNTAVSTTSYIANI